MKRLLVFLLALTSTSAMAVPSSGCSPDTAFENEQVKIWFQGFKGHLQVHDFADGTSYDYKTTELVESDAAGNPVAAMNLGRAYPQDTSACTVEETEEQVTITFGVTADVRSTVGEGTVGTASVRFVYHFNKSDNGSKFDLFVDEWPWQTADGTLAFSFTVTADGAIIESAENGIGFRDADANPRGYISWDPEFTARYADEHEETGTVDAETAIDGSSATVTLHFTAATAGYTNLIYDPWMGVGAYIVVGPLLIGDGPASSLLQLLP